MSSFGSSNDTLLLVLFLASFSAIFLLLPHNCHGARMLSSLVTQPAIPMKYHNGTLLTGTISLNFVFYGNFTASQRAILIDFAASISSTNSGENNNNPTVATWWHNLQPYYTISKTKLPTVITPRAQILDASYSFGKSLKNADVAKLATKAAVGSTNSVNVVLTAADVAVEDFCVSNCGAHWSSPSKGRCPYVWVGNSEKQCPGQCAWPFHKPIYGPQNTPLVPPNGDVGVDGMVINLAAMLAGAFTNPFVNGFYQGPADAPLEAASACSGIYGKGAYPGYPGHLLVDPITGASYNAVGVYGREYLLPALVNPATSQCSTLV